MGYTCLKMATFGGVKYRPGDVVEAEMIQPGSARAMQDMGIIAEFQDLEVGKNRNADPPHYCGGRRGRA